MDPQMLIDTTAMTDIPAPHWFVQFFKTLGFTLHSIPMNVWYAGILVAMLLAAFGPPAGKRFSARLMMQMPVIVAFGVNLGIVPLLFLQAAYGKVFYPATILMAWPWLAIVFLVIPAYYAVYYYAFAIRKGRDALTWRHHAAGWGAAVVFFAVGFLFTHGLSLMVRVDAWPELFMAHNQAGAALGTATNLGDPTLWPRWLMFWGLALTTTAAWMVLDSAWMGVGEGRAYRCWVRRFAPVLYTVGFAWFAIFGSWYVFGTWLPQVRDAMWSIPNVLLTLATGAAGALPLMLMWSSQTRTFSRWQATAIAAAQVLVIGLNATSRQVVQNIELRGYYDVLAQPTSVEWGPLVMFLVTMVAGLAVIVWLVVQAVRASANPAV